MKRIKYLVLLLMLNCSLHAQDIFFSQFYASPLTLNPALTGLSTGDLRLSLNYRDQRNNLIPINTQAASLDMKLLRGSLKNDVFSMGMVYISDVQAEGMLSSLTALLSAAYHKSMGSKKNHFVSIGMQGGVFQRKLDVGTLTFNSYYDNVNKQLFENPSSGLNLAGETSLVMDFNAGLMWYHFINKRSSVFAGVSSFHLLEPAESFLGNNEKITRRYVFNAGRRLPLSEQMSMIPNILVNSHNGILQAALGSSFEYALSESQAAFQFGAWYRHTDNLVIGSFGFEIADIQIGVSYDILSKIQTLSRTKGGLEFSLIYSPRFKNVVELSSNPGTSF